MAKGGYTINSIYSGGYSSLKSNYEKGTSYDNKIQAGSLGLTTDPRTMNLVADVSQKLASGAKYLDVTAVMPEYFDNLPKQQTKEVRRLAKLTGIDIDVHGPVINPAGIGQNGWSEAERELTEKKVLNTLMRSHELNPDGNIHVNFHSSEGAPGSQLLPPSERGKEEGNYRRMVVVNRENGRMIPLEPELRYNPGGQEIVAETLTPEKRLDMINNTEWKNSLFQIEVNRENAERILKDVHPIMVERFLAYQGGKLPQEKILPEEIPEFKKIISAGDFIEQAHLSADTLFSRAYETAIKDNDEEKIEYLKKVSEQYGNAMGISGKEIKDASKYFNPVIQANAIRQLISDLERPGAVPKEYIPIEEFAIDKGSQTFGNAVYDSYKKFKEKSPTLVIENPPAGQALATGEDVRKMVEKTRDQFVKKAVDDGMSEDRAKKEAEKLIGATWDVGHANMLRKFGYSEKETIGEAEAVKKVLKHIHLSDNFGMEHTELPMGMGNVPFKEIMKKLGEKGYEAKKLIEAGQWWQQMKSAPFQATLEGIGSPIYGMKMAPYWDQSAGLYQSYSEGMQGQWLPQINYETFGSGFSRLPPELGGSMPGAQGSRMSGRPMQ